MKIQRTTIFLALIAASLGCVVAYTELRRSYETENTANQSQHRLFDFVENEVQTLTIRKPDQVLDFKRDSEGIWQMQTPEVGPASEASIAFLLNLLVSAHPPSLDQKKFPLQISTEQLRDFGFNQSSVEVQLSLENGDSHTIILGGADFSGNSIYTRVNPDSAPEDSIEIALISGNFGNAVNRPLAEWKYQEEEANENTLPKPTESSEEAQNQIDFEREKLDENENPDPSPASDERN